MERNKRALDFKRGQDSRRKIVARQMLCQKAYRVFIRNMRIMCQYGQVIHDTATLISNDTKYCANALKVDIYLSQKVKRGIKQIEKGFEEVKHGGLTITEDLVGRFIEMQDKQIVDGYDYFCKLSDVCDCLTQAMVLYQVEHDADPDKLEELYKMITKDFGQKAKDTLEPPDFEGLREIGAKIQKKGPEILDDAVVEEIETH